MQTYRSGTHNAGGKDERGWNPCPLITIHVTYDLIPVMISSPVGDIGSATFLVVGRLLGHCELVTTVN
ncbi:hypothetical protein CEP54_003463 [Fusarium duplospermum]|uniref:Uncharacterized protein n=1 Tax=Fusarium duplospermum TaxID=1325734 RepID=A0A428QNX3_9HYPO|nr:hypothetical protein CEP54_003463 [Fusarium duplospermum]